MTTTESKGRDLFIVDNSVAGWTGLRYLEEWARIAKAFDIATGYFEIGSLLALDGKWQSLEKIRVLMGAETTQRTRRALFEAVRTRATEQLDGSLEDEKETNPFFHGADAILDALRAGQIECRVYDKNKFHAKAYITHAKLEVVGAQAMVGSSNFTRQGLTKNVELNVQIQSAREVAQLQEWFEAYWNEASDITKGSSRRSRGTPASTRRSTSTQRRSRSSSVVTNLRRRSGTRRGLGCSRVSTVTRKRPTGPS